MIGGVALANSGTVVETLPAEERCGECGGLAIRAAEASLVGDSETLTFVAVGEKSRRL